MRKTKKPNSVRNDLAIGGYKGNIYQRPKKKGRNVRWPGRAYTIEDIKISEGDTVLSTRYADALIKFVDSDKIERNFIPLTEILGDLRITPGKIKCYDTFESLERINTTTI